MDYRNKTKEELISDLKELNSKYEALRSVCDREIIARQLAEEKLVKRSIIMSSFNQYSLDLGEVEFEKIHQFIVDRFKILFNVRVVWILTYDEKLSALTLNTSTATETENSRIMNYLGQALKRHHTLIDKDRYKMIVESGTKLFSSLHEISFGQIPALAGLAIEKLFNVGWFQGVALIDKGKLLGTLVIGGEKRQDELEPESVKIFAELTSSVLRRKQTEEKLIAGDEKFRKAFAMNPDAVSINRLSDGLFVSINEGFSKITGYSEEDIKGKTSDEINIWTGPDQREKVIKGLHKAGTVQNLEGNFRQKNGSIRDGMLSATVIYLDNVPHTLSITRDITERKLAEKYLQKSEEKYRLLAENISDVIWVLDSTTMHFTYVSPSVERLLGYTPEEIIAQPVTHALTEEAGNSIIEMTRAGVKEILSGRINSNKYYTTEVEQPCKDGSSVWTEVITSFYINTENGHVEVLGVTRDITNRKDAEKALRQSELYFSDVFESVNVGLAYVSLNGELLAINKTLEDIIEVPKNEIIGRNLLPLVRKFLSDNNIKVAVPALTAIMQKKNIQPFQIEFRNKILEISGNSNKNSDRLTGVVRDITELKKAENEIHHLNARLEERVKERTAQLEAANTELQAFAYSVSHDLRAPLRAIDGFSKFVLEDYGPKLDQEGQRLLGLIRTNTRKMDNLITDILSLSRVTRSEQKKSKIDMTKMALSMLNEAVPTDIQEHISFVIDTLPEGFADPTYIKQVWINLISNAVKFTSLKKRPEIKISGYREDGRHVYYVSDNGVGFNPEYAHNLFQVFQRLHKSNEFEGNGVGLAIVQRIVHRHGGSVWAEGKEGKGATFYFSLPVTDGE